MIDLHSHILPGLDDGPRTMTESVALCKALVAEGVTHAVATPHMFDGVHDVSCEAVYQGVQDLRSELKEAGLPLHILPGAEIRVDPRVLEAAQSGLLISIGAGERYVLIELPTDIVPPRFDWFLFELQMTGLTPILTHPELNAEIQARLGVLENLIHLGCLVQMSAPSLLGTFGGRPVATARRMLRHGMAHLLSSDCHDLVHRPPRMRAALAEAASVVGVARAEMMVGGRAAAVLAGDRIDVDEPAEEPAPRAPDLLPV